MPRSRPGFQQIYVFENSKFQSFKNSKNQNFKFSKSQKFKNPWIFKKSKIQKFKKPLKKKIQKYNFKVSKIQTLKSVYFYANGVSRRNSLALTGTPGPWALMKYSFLTPVGVTCGCKCSLFWNICLSIDFYMIFRWILDDVGSHFGI